MTEVPRMRTAKQCAREIKAVDPQSGVSEYLIRQLVQRGEIPCVRRANRMLINLDVLCNYLSTCGAVDGEGEII